MSSVKLNHSSRVYPILVPTNTVDSPYGMQRIQGIDASVSGSDTKVYQVGYTDHLGFMRVPFTHTINLRQLEYGNIDIFKRMANTSSNKILLTDFWDTSFDIYYYLNNDNDDFIGTFWYPNTRLSGFGISIGDPKATVERNFNLVGENAKSLEGKYLITGSSTLSLGLKTAIINPPATIEDPDNVGEYLLLVYKNGTKLKYSEFSYSSGTLTVPDGIDGDIIRWYYMLNSFPSGSSIYTTDTSSTDSITADAVSLELTDGEYLYRIQNLGIDVSFDRLDLGEIGNRDTVINATSDTNIKITLGRKMENFTVERTLRDVSSSYGLIDPYNMPSTHDFTIKIYEDYKKDTFKCAYRFSNMGVVGMDSSVPLRDYLDQNISLSGSTGFITNDINDLT